MARACSFCGRGKPKVNQVYARKRPAKWLTSPAPLKLSGCIRCCFFRKIILIPRGSMSNPPPGNLSNTSLAGRAIEASGTKSNRAWCRMSDGKGQGVRHEVHGVTCRGRASPQFGQLFRAAGGREVLYARVPDGALGRNRPAAIASRIVRSAYKKLESAREPMHSNAETCLEYHRPVDHLLPPIFALQPLCASLR
jgi:hypothetical protein